MQAFARPRRGELRASGKCWELPRRLKSYVYRQRSFVRRNNFRFRIHIIRRYGLVRFITMDYMRLSLAFLLAKPGDFMIICSCNVFSDTDVRNAVSSERCPRTLSAVYKCLGCSPSCGRCLAAVRTIFNERLTEHAASEDSCRTRIAEAVCPAKFDKSVPSLEPDPFAACGESGRRQLYAII
jgi:bacterioferritin-associated ferredoxin